MFCSRIQPDEEEQWIISNLEHYFNCNHDLLPSDWLAHKFLWLFAGQTHNLDDYRKCVINATGANIPSKYNLCVQNLKDICPFRFGTDLSKSYYCRDQIQNIGNIDQNIKFSDYRKCSKDLSCKIKPCVLNLNEQCKQNDITAIKSVRLTMASVEKLLKLIPDLKVIHYIRDPRAVALSRQMDQSVRGIYALKRQPIQKAGQLYCQDLERDIRTSRYLQQLYPQNILEIYYEELATFPELITTRIYDFIDRPVPQTLMEWIGNNTSTSKKGWTSRVSVDIITKWTKVMSEETRVVINKYCKEVYKMSKMKWIMSGHL